LAAVHERASRQSPPSPIPDLFPTLTAAERLQLAGEFTRVVNSGDWQLTPDIVQALLLRIALGPNALESSPAGPELKTAAASRGRTIQSQEKQARALELERQGWSIDEIAEDVEVEPDTIRRWRTAWRKRS
jgi:hypothetical protein